MAENFQRTPNSIDLYEQALNIERQKIALQKALSEGDLAKARFWLHSLREARHFQAENSFGEELKAIEFREKAAFLRMQNINVRVAKYQAHQNRDGKPVPDPN